MKRIAALALAAALLSSQPAGADPSGFAAATAPYRYSWPRDHGSHPAYRTEWWYFTGHLRARDGRRFGFELTFFRAGLRPGDPVPQAGRSRWRGNQLFPAHFALTDESGRRFFHDERLAREALGFGAASSSRLAVRADDWALEGMPIGSGARQRITLHASAAFGSLALRATPLKDPAIHGRGGVSRKGACASCASHYYSFTRLATTGTVRLADASYEVEGQAWMDHEYGTGELEPNQRGWDWYSIQLDDGRELMLYVLRRSDGSVTPQSSGTLVERDGRTRYLPLAAFASSSDAVWKSPHSGAVYPAHWRVSVPSAGLDLMLSPVVADQELAATTNGISYWEGAVDVTAAGAPGRRVGAGYVELTGYAGALQL
ncbi:MAG: carotenoid 1,2-hydratase [Candidatus Eremiobacteraeota bacterium]|nr:carotenoid 1,2-hydratase [Candidatus Eremiobacteraeota bacterium]